MILNSNYGGSEGISNEMFPTRNWILFKRYFELNHLICSETPLNLEMSVLKLKSLHLKQGFLLLNYKSHYEDIQCNLTDGTILRVWRIDYLF